MEGLERFLEVYDAKVIPEGAGASVYRPMFADGKVGMMIDNGAVPAIVQGMNDTVSLSAAPIPFPVASQGAIMGPIVLNAASEKKEAAAVFLDWLLQQENQEALQALLGASSVATHTNRTATQLQAAPYLSVYDGLTETGLPHIVPGFEARDRRHPQDRRRAGARRPGRSAGCRDGPRHSAGARGRGGRRLSDAGRGRGPRWR